MLFVKKEQKNKPRKKWTSPEITERFEDFQRILSTTSRMLNDYPKENLFGFGAAQMLPCLAYHMPCHLSSLKAIIDDDPLRQGKVYPGLAIPIEGIHQINVEKATFLITALDSMRPIIRRLTECKAKRILSPILAL